MKVLLFLFLLFFSLVNNAQNFQSQHFYIEKLSPNIYAAIAKNGGYAICNAGVVDLGKEVLVFDPFMTPQAATDLLKFINTTIKKPVRFVVNSHAHNDHIRGNQVFKNATIIATPVIRETIAKTEPLEIADEKEYAPARMRYYDSIGIEKDKWQAVEDSLWRGYFEGILKSHPILKTTLPNFVFTDSLTIYGDKTIVKLVSFGDGHTASDVFMFLPKEKIAFMGDLLFTEFHPWIGDSKLKNWITYLQRVNTLNITTLVSGHGPPGNSGDLDKMISYLGAVRRIANELNSPEVTDEAINKKMPAEYSSWHGKRFFNFNIRYAAKNPD
ncbi:MAG: MBL fold metallo-hydrolase [Chitinophagaceae bacterium]|nr:MBL fold metallo-hydrolase [Chitinophagaceae bacterium]